MWCSCGHMPFLNGDALPAEAAESEGTGSQAWYGWCVWTLSLFDTRDWISLSTSPLITESFLPYLRAHTDSDIAACSFQALLKCKCRSSCIATVFLVLWDFCCGAAVPDSWLQGCQQWAGSWHSAPGWWWPALPIHLTGSAPSPPTHKIIKEGKKI